MLHGCPLQDIFFVLQVRHALVHECELLYECRVCRNLFRSVVNFLAHKRIFCTQHYGENRSLYSEVCSYHPNKSVLIYWFIFYSVIWILLIFISGLHCSYIQLLDMKPNKVRILLKLAIWSVISQGQVFSEFECFSHFLLFSSCFVAYKLPY